MKKILYIISIISLVLINGCSSKIEETDIFFWDIKLGFSEEQIVKKMGSPTTNKTAGDNKELYYKEVNGPGAIFDFKNDTLVKAVWYPSSYDSISTIPSTIETVDLSHEYTIEQESCYESAQCNKYVFENTSSKLQIVMDWKNEVIDQVTLSVK